MSTDGVIWFNARLGVATVSLASYGLVFSRAAVADMGAPSHVKLGFDAGAQKILVAPVVAGDPHAIEFASRERDGYVRLNIRDFVRLVRGQLRNKSIGLQTMRFLATWCPETQILTVDLQIPLDSSPDGEGEEDNRRGD
jgi:hypothetical protein